MTKQLTEQEFDALFGIPGAAAQLEQQQSEEVKLDLYKMERPACYRTLNFVEHEAIPGRKFVVDGFVQTEPFKYVIYRLYITDEEMPDIVLDIHNEMKQQPDRQMIGSLAQMFVPVKDSRK